MMKLFFVLAAVSPPFFALFEKGATGILLSLFFLLLAAVYSKPRPTKTQ